MMQMRKRIYTFALVMLLAVGVFLGAPITAHALVAQPIPAGGSIAVPGLYDISTTTETTITTTVNGVALTGTKSNLKVIINPNITLTLKDAHITGPSGDVAIYAGGANCGLILVGTNSATATGGGGAGVAVPNASSIVIEGPGQLTATGGSGAAGIGGSTGASNGSITIRHAVIIANGTSSGAGIGGGSGNAASFSAGAGSNITITNSSVVATGGNASDAPTGGGAGIGGGGGGVDSAGGAGGNITITNSVVHATGGAGYTDPSNMGTAGGAGIGGGGGNKGFLGGAGTSITIDAFSSVQANGGNGANGTSNGGGGGGAAVGGGGGGGANASGGTANDISIGNNTLSTGSAPGTGGTGTPPASGGALCGNGGSGNSNTSGTEFGAVTVTGPNIDLTSRPQVSYAGYPAFPSTTNPTNQTVSAGNNASFSVTASGGKGTPYYYQWQASADSGTNWADIDSATNTSAATSSLSITNVAAADHGKLYRCIVYDSVFREATSAGASLSVNTSPTITGDTTLTLSLGYAGTSTGVYSITGNPAPTVTKTSGNAAITWDDTNKKLNIAAGLSAGSYPVELTASNGVLPDATLTFTLIVEAPAASGDFTPTYTQRTLTDQQTGVTVTGQIATGARLTVRERILRAEGSCPACDEIRARQAAGELIILYDISISGGYTGDLEVSIPVGDQYNGQTVTILHCVNGKLESVTCVVQNGVAKGTFKKLSPFAVVRGANVSVPENTVVDPPKTGSGSAAPLGAVLMACALWVGLLLWKRRIHHR